MSRIFKTAGALSLALSAVAFIANSDVSLAAAAEEAEPTEIMVDPVALAKAEEEWRQQDVVFQSNEVVQDIPDEVIEADLAANEAAEATADTLHDLVAQQSVDGPLSEQMHCLAGTVYFESKGESLHGQLAVAKVVLARAESSRFPDSICGVVYQRKQFSFVRGGRMPRINTSGRHWRNAVAIAKIARDNAWRSQVEGALFFHARYVNPGWRLQRIATIDNHVFYR